VVCQRVDCHAGPLDASEAEVRLVLLPFRLLKLLVALSDVQSAKPGKRFAGEPNLDGEPEVDEGSPSSTSADPPETRKGP